MRNEPTSKSSHRLLPHMIPLDYCSPAIAALSGSKPKLSFKYDAIGMPNDYTYSDFNPQFPKWLSLELATGVYATPVAGGMATEIE